MMDNSSTSAEASPFVVEADGCFGTVAWTVAEELYAVLPRKERDAVLAMTGRRVILPFMNDQVDHLLRQADYHALPACDLDPGFSLETLEDACTFGRVNWLIGQGLWDALPDDQRSSLMQLALQVIHQFFHANVERPLGSYAVRQFRS